MLTDKQVRDRLAEYLDGGNPAQPASRQSVEEERDDVKNAGNRCTGRYNAGVPDALRRLGLFNGRRPGSLTGPPHLKNEEQPPGLPKAQAAWSVSTTERAWAMPAWADASPSARPSARTTVTSVMPMKASICLTCGTMKSAAAAGPLL